ncbi:MAG: hypothetical protein LBC07_05180 [Elusimicrobiota bacterium]|jgi:hypothetical protein|nr:hypothetical protein [Elusimicrobiota bacterium]
MKRLKQLKIVLLGIFLLSAFWQQSFAGKTLVVDTPTTKIIEYGSYEIGFKVFDGGAVEPELLFGIFNFLNLGISWEVLDLLGHEQADPAIPAAQAKVQLYSGNMAFPAIAIGYDGQGYIHKSDAKDRYYQEPIGLYLVIGKEVISEGAIMNIGINSYALTNDDIYGFLNLSVPIGSEYFLFLAELDRIRDMSKTRLNLGLRIILQDGFLVDLIVRDCWGAPGNNLYPNDRILSLSYTGQF